MVGAGRNAASRWCVQNLERLFTGASVPAQLLLRRLARNRLSRTSGSSATESRMSKFNTGTRSVSTKQARGGIPPLRSSPSGLLRSTALDEKAAFVALVRPYRGGLPSISRRMLGDASQAAHVVQRALPNIQPKAASYSPAPTGKRRAGASAAGNGRSVAPVFQLRPPSRAPSAAIWEPRSWPCPRRRAAFCFSLLRGPTVP